MKGEVIHVFPAGFRQLGAGFFASIPIPIWIGLALLMAVHVVVPPTPLGRALFSLRVNAADSGTGEELLLTAIAAVCLGGTSLFGGVGGIVGTAIGSLILALVVNGMNMLGIATFWQAFAMGVIV